MSIILTPQFTDSFHRADENPLANPPWSVAAGTPSLQIVSDACQASDIAFNGNVYEGAVPDDQYASVTIASLTNNPELLLYVRQSGDLQRTSGTFYQLLVFLAFGSFDVFQSPTNNFLLGVSGLTIAVGDVWTLAAIGTTIYVLQNGIELGSVSDSSIASGNAALGAEVSVTLSDVTYSLFAAGSAATGSAISGNAGVAGATVVYSGTASGSVTADGSGNYTTPALANGNYTITWNPSSQCASSSSSGLKALNTPSSIFVLMTSNRSSIPRMAFSSW